MRQPHNVCGHFHHPAPSSLPEGLLGKEEASHLSKLSQSCSLFSANLQNTPKTHL